MMVTVCNDASFGPVSNCRFFDFTLAFENILLILPSCLLTVVSLIEVLTLSRKPTLIHQRRSLFHSRQLRNIDEIGLLRIVISLVHAIVSVTLFALAASSSQLQQILDRQTILPALSLSMMSAFSLIPFSLVARLKLPNGSLLLPLYLFAATLIDACRLRTYLGIPALQDTSQIPLMIIILILKSLMLMAENTSGIQTMQSTRESSASFISKMLFWWLKDVIWTGFRRPLEMVNLDRLAEEYEGRALGARLAKVYDSKPSASYRINLRQRGDSETMPRDSESAIEMRNLQHPASGDEGDNIDSETIRRRSLLWACFRAFPLALLEPVTAKIAMSGITLALPYLIADTLSFAQSQQNSNTAQPSAYGWGLVGAYGFVYLVLSFSTGQFFWSCDKSTIKLRGAILDMIYRKSLRMHLSVARTTGGGAAANLMAVDLERFIKGIIPFHHLWSGLLVVTVASYLLYRELGLIFFASLVSVILSLLFPPIASRGIGDKQARWSKATDKRVNLTSSAISNAKGVKFMAYEEKIVENLIQGREEEIHHGWAYYKQLLLVAGFTNLVTEIMAMTTFSTVAIVDYLSGSQRLNINMVVTSLTLMQLLQDPLLRMGQDYGAIVAALVSLRRIEEFLGKEEVSRQYLQSQSSSSTRNHSLLYGERNGETDKDINGFEDIKKIGNSFAASFQSASIGWSNYKPILVNITLDIPLNQITMICGTLASGKSTLLQSLLGETNLLSGSLKLPIKENTIAYVAQDGWLQEGATIRENIIFDSPFLPERYTSVIKATALHIDLVELPLHDRSLAKALSGGQRQRVTLARALYADAPTYLLDDFTSALDAETASHVWKSLVGSQGLLFGKTVVMATNALEYLHHADFLIRLDEGRIVEKGSYENISDKLKSIVKRTSIEADRAQSESHQRDDDKGKKNVEEKEVDEQHEEVEQGTVQWSVYLQWIKAMGLGWIGSTIILDAACVAAKLGWNAYLQFWAKAASDDPTHQHTLQWMGGLNAVIVVSMLTLGISLYTLCYGALVNSGRKLHQAELKGVFGTSLSFFEQNASGRIINRFSQDLFVLDWEIILALANFLGNSLELIGSLIILVIPAPFLAIVILIVTVLYFGIQRLYAPSSRQLRRLEMATKSPIYTLFSETSTPAGLATIRGLNRQELFIDINIGRLNRSQQPYLYLQAVRRWLQTWLNLLSLIINVALVAVLVILRKTSSIGILGVGLVQATNISNALNQSLISYTELEIASVALERILAFAQLPKEQGDFINGKLRIKMRPEEVRGMIEFRNVSIAYEPDLKPAIKNLSLTIRAGEKIGICGRSGSGKSTLLLAIFAMLEASSGEIYLDGQAISTMSSFHLRNSLTIVPQNALILTSTVRDNLDPHGTKTDVDIWNALETCQLLNVVKAFPMGLDTLLSNEINLSAGQRQLFSLARALLRQRKILVLDEATSNMDYETDAAVQRVLRKQFYYCTIITVAHRIATVRDYDRILVLSGGQLAELDTPDNLIKRENSIFQSLAQEQGVR